MRILIQKIISIIFIFLLLPLLLFTSIIIIIFDGRPVFYKQKRLGKNNKKFSMYKFRTMVNNVGDIPKGMIKDPDTYITNSGKLLRKLSIDELPQLLNVLKGDMNFIGYRPCLVNEEELIDLRKQKSLCGYKPGITGWAQINGRDNISNEEKAFLDSFYFSNRSLFFDLKILFLTAYVVILKKNVSH